MAPDPDQDVKFFFLIGSGTGSSKNKSGSAALVWSAIDIFFFFLAKIAPFVSKKWGRRQEDRILYTFYTIELNHSKRRKKLVFLQI